MVELMTVVLVIAVLLAIAMPMFLGAETRASDRAAQANMHHALIAENMVFTDNEQFSTSNTALRSAEPRLIYVSTVPAKDSAEVYVDTDSANATVVLVAGRCDRVPPARVDAGVGGVGAEAPVEGGAASELCWVRPWRKCAHGFPRSAGAGVEVGLAEFEIAVEQPPGRAERGEHEHRCCGLGGSSERCHGDPATDTQREECKRRGGHRLRFDEVHGQNQEGEAEEWAPRPTARHGQPNCESDHAENASCCRVFDEDVVGVDEQPVRALGVHQRQVAGAGRGSAEAPGSRPEEGVVGDGVPGAGPHLQAGCRADALSA